MPALNSLQFVIVIPIGKANCWRLDDNDLIYNWREGFTTATSHYSSENQPEFQVQVKNNHLVDIGKECMVEGRHVEQVKVKTNRVDHCWVLVILQLCYGVGGDDDLDYIHVNHCP